MRARAQRREKRLTRKAYLEREQQIRAQARKQKRENKEKEAAEKRRRKQEREQAKVVRAQEVAAAGLSELASGAIVEREAKAKRIELFGKEPVYAAGVGVLGPLLGIVCRSGLGGRAG